MGQRPVNWIEAEKPAYAPEWGIDASGSGERCYRYNLTGIVHDVVSHKDFP
jgi:hypothetical protein